MKKIGSKFDESIKDNITTVIVGNDMITVETEITLFNGYKATEKSEVSLDNFRNAREAKNYGKKINYDTLKTRLDEIYDYILFINNRGLTMIRVEDWNEYMKLKTFHENLKDGTMLNMDFFKTKEPLDARHIVISMKEYKALSTKIEPYSLLDKDGNVIKKSKEFNFNNGRERYVVLPISDWESLNKDHEVLEKLYDAGVDNWVGYDDALNDDEKMED